MLNLKTNEMTLEDVLEMLKDKMNSQDQESKLILEFEELRNAYLKDKEDLQSRYLGGFINILKEINTIRNS